MQRVCRNCKFCLVDPGMEECDPDPFYCDLTVEKTDPEHECEFIEGFEPKTTTYSAEKEVERRGR